MPRVSRLAWLATVLIVAGCSGKDSSPVAPTGASPAPTAVAAGGSGGQATGLGTTAGASSATQPAHGGGSISLPDDLNSGNAAFPPRNEPYDFRVQLEAKYRDGLRRTPVSSYVDIEGTIVWTQEYLRYRLASCLHSEAIQRVFRQIDGFGVQPTCGAETTTFPPRDQPFDFRIQLEAKYRDGLRRSATQTYVDTEGDIVWTQEYLRYRVSGCDHADSTSRVFAQIDGRGVQPDCASPAGGGGDYLPGESYTWHLYSATLTGTGVWTLTWADRSVDLDLVVTTESCDDPMLSGCSILGYSIDENTTSEEVFAPVQSGRRYKAWVYNWSTRGQAYSINAYVVGGDFTTSASRAGGQRMSPEGAAAPDSTQRMSKRRLLPR